ncbi:hypothetical protein C6369_025765 [Rhodococcus rhodochrous]|nr:hypothetical protein C6369_025765 [Rhodococcus rhodochrous]
MVGIDAMPIAARRDGVPPEASAPPGHLVDYSSAMDGAAVVIGDVIAREGAVAAWSIPGRSRGRTVPADPHFPRVVDGSDRRRGAVCRPVRRCPASEVLPALDARFLRKRCGRPMLPEVRCARPSIDLPSLTLTRVIEHVFPRVQSDFRFSELLVCFADGVFGG